MTTTLTQTEEATSANSMAQTFWATTLDKSMPVTKYQLRRDNVSVIHNDFRRITSLDGGRNCNKSPRRGNKNNIGLHRTTYADGHSKATYSHLQTCKSWACPFCSQYTEWLDLRSTIIAAEKHIATGGTVVFLTLTMGTKEAHTPYFKNAKQLFHKSKEYRDLAAYRTTDAYAASSLEDRRKYNKIITDREEAFTEEFGQEDSHVNWDLNKRWNALTVGRSYIFQGATFKRERELYNVVGRLTSTELRVTPHKNADGTYDFRKVAHNLHLHIALFIDSRLNDVEHTVWADKIKARWMKSVRKSGFTATKAAQSSELIVGDDIRKVTSYLNKEASEFLRGKKVNEDVPSDSMSRFEVLRHAGGGWFNDNGDMMEANKDAALWYKQMEQVQFRRTKFSKSDNFYRDMGVLDEIARLEEERKSTSVRETILSFTQGSWQELNREYPSARTELLNLVENGSNDAVFLKVETYGVSFIKPSLENIVEEDWSEQEMDAGDDMYGSEIPF